jgi:dihydroorotate dehydrogenase (NAD+) catalytic subunit
MPGMVIDAEAGRPVLSNRVGGISGPALKPVALRCVYEIARAVHVKSGFPAQAGLGTRVPIIGTGGVLTGRDAAEMIMAGATAVGVGSAVWYRGVEVLGEIAAELAAFMAHEGYATLEDMRGLAHREG